MIDRKARLSIKRQCALLKVPRSTAYYKPAEVPEGDLQLMRRIDELHLMRPFAGSRMMRDFLTREGYKIGRRHVRTLMRRMASCTESPTRAVASQGITSTPIF
jgi:putative transposase